MKFNLGVKGIIRKNNKILVVKRSANDDHKPGVWETPGGRIEEQEFPQDALKREIKEETNLDVNVIEPFNVFTLIRDTGEYVVGITFICEYVSGKIKLSDEHSEYKWIEPQEFKKLKSVPSLKKEIDSYYKKYGK